MFNDVVTLITITGGTKDKDGFLTEETKLELEVFASVDSVRREEFYKAVSAGVKADLSVTVNEDDYNVACTTNEGRKIYPSKVVYEGNDYRIVRAYHLKKDLSYELTLQEVE